MSGNGKTTLARAAASRLGVPHVELDALNHLAGWQQADDDQFRHAVDDATSTEGWVVDGSYQNRLGTLLYGRADEIVWLDQPLPLVLARLVRRALTDIVTRRDLYNGNRQSWRWAFWGRDALVPFAMRMHFQRRREWPEQLAAQPARLSRLRTPRQVAAWLASVSRES